MADRFGLDWVRGGLGARGTGTGPHGNRLSVRVKFDKMKYDQKIRK